MIGAALFVVTAMVASCREPTSLEIDVRTNLAAADVRGTAFVVAGTPFAAEERVKLTSWSATTNAVGPDGHVGTLVAIPEGGRNEGSVSIVVVVGVGRNATSCAPPKFEGCIVARRQLAYRAHTRLRLPIVLETSCVDVPCDATSTCAKGSCVSANVDCNDDGSCDPPARLVPVDAGNDPDATLDAPLPSDGDPPDARPDGSDAATDGGDASPGPTGNDCPTNAGTIDCRTTSSAPDCCFYSTSFFCTSSCPGNTYSCTGRRYCSSAYCCGTDMPPSASCGTSCAHFVCTGDGDCPPQLPRCTKRYYPTFGSTFVKECEP